MTISTKTETGTIMNYRILTLYSVIGAMTLFKPADSIASTINSATTTGKDSIPAATSVIGKSIYKIEIQWGIKSMGSAVYLESVAAQFGPADFFRSSKNPSQYGIRFEISDTTRLSEAITWASKYGIPFVLYKNGQHFDGYIPREVRTAATEIDPMKTGFNDKEPYSITINIGRDYVRADMCKSFCEEASGGKAEILPLKQYIGYRVFIGEMDEKTMLRVFNIANIISSEVIVRKNGEEIKLKKSINQPGSFYVVFMQLTGIKTYS